MDNNVVFDPAKPGVDPNQASQDTEPSQTDPSQGDQTAATTETPTSDPPAEVPQDAAGDPSGEVPVEGEPPVEEGVAEGTEAVEGEVDPSAEDPQEPPPPPPVGFLGNIPWKKILIGLGILIVLIIVINLLIPKSTSSKQVKLQWWGLWEESPAIQTLIIDFKKTHPTIDIEYVKKDPQDYRDRLITRIQNGTGPDIFRFHNTWMPMLTDSLLPLSTDVISPEEYKKAYYPVMQKDLTKNGAIYGIPMDADSLSMFVNPQLFEAAGVQVPANWDDFVKVARKLTVKDANGKIKSPGAALGTYANVSHAPDIISLLMIQQGVDMTNFTKVSADQQKAQQGALNFYTSFALGDNKVWDGTMENSRTAFGKGNLPIYFGFSWDVFAIQRLNKDLTFKIYPVPELYGKKITVASYWAEGVSAKSPNQKAAMEFMHYLAQKDTAQKFYTETAKTRAFGEPYARVDLRESLREQLLVYPFVSQLDNAGSSMFASDTHDGDTGLNSLANTYLQKAVESLIQTGDSPETTVADLNTGITQVLQKYGQLPQ